MSVVAALMTGDVLFWGDSAKPQMLDLGKCRQISRDVSRPNYMRVDNQDIDLGTTTYASIQPQVESAFTAGASAAAPPPPPVTGNINATSAVISGLSSVAGLSFGMIVTGPGIPPSSTLQAVLSSSSIQISAPATATTVGATVVFSTAPVESGLPIYPAIARQPNGDWIPVRAVHRVSAISGRARIGPWETYDDLPHTVPGTNYTYGCTARSFDGSVTLVPATPVTVTPPEPWDAIEIVNETVSELTVTHDLGVIKVPAGMPGNPSSRPLTGLAFGNEFTIVGAAGGDVRWSVARSARDGATAS